MNRQNWQHRLVDGIAGNAVWQRDWCYRRSFGSSYRSEHRNERNEGCHNEVAHGSFLRFGQKAFQARLYSPDPDVNITKTQCPAFLPHMMKAFGKHLIGALITAS